MFTQTLRLFHHLFLFPSLACMLVFLFPWCTYSVASCNVLCGTLLPFLASCIVHPASRIASCIVHCASHRICLPPFSSHSSHSSHSSSSASPLSRWQHKLLRTTLFRHMQLCRRAFSHLSIVHIRRPSGSCLRLQLAPSLLQISFATDTRNTRNTRNTRDNTRTIAKDTWHLALGTVIN